VAQPRPRWDRITSQPDPALEGQVVSAAQQPRSGTRVLFVNADQSGARQAATTDTAGRFRVTLASGNWLIYVQDAGGNSVFQRKVEVVRGKPSRMTLMSR